MHEKTTSGNGGEPISMCHVSGRNNKAQIRDQGNSIDFVVQNFVKNMKISYMYFPSTLQGNELERIRSRT